MSTRFPINRWAPNDRPREKLVKYGHKSLTNSELLAILLGSGTPNESAVMLAQRMLAQYDNHLDQLAQCSVEELCEFHGVGLHSIAFNSTAVNRFLTFFNLISEIYSTKNFG
jgi:DNA repair protein RadC